MIFTIANVWIWVGFSLFLFIALTIDTFVLADQHKRSLKTLWGPLYWTTMWVSLALVFNLVFWLYLRSNYGLAIANRKALEFFTGYLIEESLSVDNLFVFYVIFHHLRIPVHCQQRVLSYGIWGAVIMRLLVILFGVWLVNRFHWVLYLMGLFLLITGLKILFLKEKKPNMDETWLLRFIKRFLRVTHEFEGNKFFIRKKHVLYATPLFIAVIFVEFSDLVFAMDSIPAIFAITRDPFIIWTSNIFAILGLRALYFLLAGMLDRFAYLKYGVALILVFVGVKMVGEPWFDIPIGISLVVILSTLVIFIGINHRLLQKRGKYAAK